MVERRRARHLAEITPKATDKAATLRKFRLAPGGFLAALPLA
jgi:hypothetical protein